MSPHIDPAILAALSLDAATTTIVSHGSSGFASTSKIVSKREDGGEKLYFVKQGRGRGIEDMFKGEHTSLNAIHTIIPTLCPKSHAHGPLRNSSGFFLATDFLDLNPKPSAPSSNTSSGLSLAQKLAKLHTTRAPIPEGYDKPQFGFPVLTCCGDTVQDNSFQDSWATFYANNRLRRILKTIESNHGPDPSLHSLVERTATAIVPRLLRDGHLKSSSTGGNIQPVLVHGDLWSGNHGKGSIDGGGVEEVVYDPSASWSHGEFEFGIMGMFGGFGEGFEGEYYEAKEGLREGGRDEPVGEWRDRRRLYELYHHLNHYSIFGRGYRGGAMSTMEGLITKYGDEAVL
ncbi:Fructosamine/Ketosamine-3-kinase [Amylocarpus encephaloides]|uniref:protein-ribulosamine 3-kinase n=1 Tax=Amylocarpus encephaloides TaxID=45428 RepID=A0A9P8C252_9HELO|nr:Fructosamine/Ketosamine-3-kinase [Amylocarpus encephaloides]